jgi:hypothetical protein
LKILVRTDLRKLEDLEVWRELSLSTDFPKEEPATGLAQAASAASPFLILHPA